MNQERKRYPEKGSMDDLLMVEGPDDYHLLLHLLAHHNLLKKFTVEEGKGLQDLLDSLKVRLKLKDQKQLGIVVDADTDILTRWQSLRDILVRAGYITVPTTPQLEGTIITQPDMPSIGIWLMPNNQIPGILEDFGGFLVPKEDKLWARAVRCVQQIPEEERNFLPQHIAKANLHTWLAWQAEPGSPIGQAITKKYLDADASQALQLIDWMRRLFQV